MQHSPAGLPRLDFLEVCFRKAVAGTKVRILDQATEMRQRIDSGPRVSPVVRACLGDESPAQCEVATSVDEILASNGGGLQPYAGGHGMSNEGATLRPVKSDIPDHGNE